MRERRLRVLMITKQRLVDMLKSGDRAYEITKGLPDDSEIVATLDMDVPADALAIRRYGPAEAIALVIWSSEFELLEPAANVPDFESPRLYRIDTDSMRNAFEEARLQRLADANRRKT